MKIVTIYNDHNQILSKKAEKIPLTKEGLEEAKEIVDQLYQTLMPLMPAAGLAAPQIGISKQVFLYSYDGQVENIKTMVNPIFEPLNQETDLLWEGCFSAIQGDGDLKIALVERYIKILVTYNDLNGETQKQIFEYYPARIFQHEYDHLQGVVNVYKKGAIIKEFTTREAMSEFMKEFKESSKDRIKYIIPKPIIDGIWYKA
jgi:peptide deformylase